ncbi:MAG: NADH-quinone oxidoreductase subunit L [Bacteroidetes bacterium]|nr:NADH-quinone oxidoreductase subunit L [Bacteroidota bacterium]
MTPESIVFLNLMLYLLGFVFLLGLQYTVFKELSGWISLIFNVMGLVVSSSVELNYQEFYAFSYHWLNVGDTHFEFKYVIDNQSYFMYILVQIIALAVQLFSTRYLKNDPGINRFFAFLNLFVFSMLGVVLSGNMLQLYFFWELVGFCSYLLIGFWFTKKSANDASLKAFLMNRVGDALFLAGIFTFFLIYGTLDFQELPIASITGKISHFPFLTVNEIQNLAVLLVFGGVTAKSAQLPLQTWLPDAMEGPTPASALIHAATMVVAGVYLLGRISPIIPSEAGLIIALIGSFTSVLAGLSAAFQYDIKKVLAYSTISQLGFMVAGMGMGAVGASLFHLATHAFFKAGLFLSAGAVIHYLHHEQDMRKMGNLIKKIPVIFYFYLICSAALIGVPLTSGFLSKEALLNAAVAYGYENHIFSIKTLVPIFMGITAFLTAFYMVRQIVMVFFERQESPVEKIIDSTRKTFGKTIKSIQDILNAENESLGEDRVIQFFRNLGVFDVAVIFLGLGSGYFLFSKSVFEYKDVWFLKIWGGGDIHFHWVPFAVYGLMILALLISYNTTFEELRRYYLGETKQGWQKLVANFLLNHFYIDKLYVAISSKLTSFKTFGDDKKPGFEGIQGLIYYFDKNWVDGLVNKLGNLTIVFSSLVAVFEKRFVDGSVLGISGGLSSLGNRIRSFAKGQLQFYVLGMVALTLGIILIRILLV